MSVGVVPYLTFAGDARAALMFYAGVFGGEVEMHTFQFDRDDGPGDAVAHGELRGPVPLFTADAGDGEQALRLDGVQFSLLGSAEPEELERWFAALADGGTVIDPLQRRPWGAHDGRLRDRFGVPWLIGYEV